MMTCLCGKGISQAVMTLSFLALQTSSDSEMHQKPSSPPSVCSRSILAAFAQYKQHTGKGLGARI